MKTYELSGPDFNLIDLVFAHFDHPHASIKAEAERLRHQFLAAHSGELQIETEETDGE